MMIGGGLMMLFGLLLVLGVVGLPVLLIGAAIAGVWGLSGRGRSAHPDPVVRQVYQSPMPTTQIIRSCSHCGQGLQPGWTHCPYCGATV